MKTFVTVVGPFQCNCYMLASKGEAVLVDPGDEPQKILKMVKDQGSPRIKALIHTHGHLDHIAASKAVWEALGEHKPKLYLHRGDLELYQNLKRQGAFFGLNYEDPREIDEFFEDEQGIEVGDLKFTVLHTPGHSPGSVCLRLHQGGGATESLFSGDTLFKGSVGRTDLWGGDADLMFKNIRNRLLTLDGDTKVLPGHGDVTSIQFEKRENPFLT